MAETAKQEPAPASDDSGMDALRELLSGKVAPPVVMDKEDGNKPNE